MRIVRRLLIILIILIYNEFFNILAIQDIYIGPITIWDVVTLFALAYLFLELTLNKVSYNKLNFFFSTTKK